MTRRTWLAAVAACPARDSVPLDFAHLPETAHALAADLDLGPGAWSVYRRQQQQTLTQRIQEGSAEHVTYYALQSQTFTLAAPLDPVRLAATHPQSLIGSARQRFTDFAAATPKDERHRLIRDLFQALPAQWTAEACFLHTMRFLQQSSQNRQAGRDALYQRRGLSSDTAPQQTLVIHRALALLGPLTGRILLVGPGLDLTRREGFRDSTPLSSYQVDRLLALKLPLDCADVRPEVLAALRTRPVCPLELDISTTAASATGRYSLIVATNVLLYLDDRALFAALAGFARALTPGGALVHNDQRFATKVFGEVLGLPATRFVPVPLGRRQGIEQMDRAVIHRRS